MVRQMRDLTIMNSTELCNDSQKFCAQATTDLIMARITPWQGPSIKQLVVLLLIAAFTSLVTVGFVPISYPEAGLDPSWQQGMVEATDSGRVFGQDLVFTYGPLHQAATHQASNNLRAMLLGKLIFTTSWFASVVLIGLLLDWKAVSAVALATALAYAPIPGPHADVPFYQYFLMAIVTYLALIQRHRGWPQDRKSTRLNSSHSSVSRMPSSA